MENAIKLYKDTKTMTIRCLRISFRNTDTIVTSVLIPVLMMLLFSYVFGGAMDVGDGSYVNYIVPGILIQCIGQGVSNTSISVSNDVHKGIVDRFCTMPICKSSILMGHAIESILRSTMSTILVIIVAFVVGFRPSANIMGWALIFVVLLLYIVMISWLSIYFGILAKSAEGAGAFAVFAIVLPYISSGFVPVDTMPKLLRIFAEHQPMTPIIDTIRSLSLGTALDVQTVIVAIVWCIALGILFYILSIRLFKRKIMA
ncbi:MAG: ABC transporter permease [Longicatena sp.]